MSLDYANLDQLRRSHPAWRLLRSDHAPLVASFLHRVFIEPNVRVIQQADLADRFSEVRAWIGALEGGAKHYRVVRSDIHRGPWGAPGRSGSTAWRHVSPWSANAGRRITLPRWLR